VGETRGKTAEGGEGGGIGREKAVVSKKAGGGGGGAAELWKPTKYNVFLGVGKAWLLLRVSSGNQRRCKPEKERYAKTVTFRVQGNGLSEGRGGVIRGADLIQLRGTATPRVDAVDDQSGVGAGQRSKDI